MFLKRPSPMLRSLKNPKRTGKVFLAVFLLFGLIAAPALAQVTEYGLGEAQAAGFGQATLIVLVLNIIRIVLGLLGLIAVILLLYAGFLWLTAAGNEDQITKAKKVIKQAIIGIVIIFASVAIVSFVINALSGNFWGTIEPPNPPGPSPTLPNWGIGRGPIESVYPAPGDKDIPINTAIVVTFKEAVDPSTICNAGAGGGCNGETMKNVSICLLAEAGGCVPDADQFGKNTFTGTTVNSTSDKRTFVFVTKQAEGVYLGNDDGQNRKFQVTLGSGIASSANPTDSIFSALAGNQYWWSFETNGRFDFNPPEVLKNGAYPYADNQADEYSVDTPATTGALTLTFSGNPVAESLAKVNNQEFTGQTLSVALTSSGGQEATVVSESGFSVATSGSVNFVVNGAGTQAVFGATSSAILAGQTLGISGNVINLGNGLVVQGNLAAGSSWSFNVSAQSNGNSLIIKNGNEQKNYLFVENSVTAEEINKDNLVYKTVKVGGNLAATLNNLKTVINDSAASWVGAVISGDDKLVLTAVRAGQNNLTVAVSAGVIAASGELSGAERIVNSENRDKRDVDKNTIFQINFNEGINPVYLENNIVVKTGGSNINGVRLEYSNNYQTVEILPPATAEYECGVNSCGKTVYCWPVLGDAQEYEMELAAAPLSVIETICQEWGGEASGNGRCQKTIASCNAGAGCDKAFHPLASFINPNGLIDLAFNSFNGSFDAYVDSNGELVGIAEGRTGSGAGYSQNSVAYDLNLGGYDHPAYQYGDDFKWSFYVANRIDLTPPLIKTINPEGDGQSQARDKEVEINFDRLMRSATLKPGWDKDSLQRFIVFDTLTAGANYLGYWLSKTDLDLNNDQAAEETVVLISHDDFAQGVLYGPLVGSGVESITQNCFLPAGGPNNASGSCRYNQGGSQEGCAPTVLPNPTSYGYWNCREVGGQIAGIEICQADQVCQPLAESGEGVEEASGSWIITKDLTRGSNSATTIGCCLGKCVNRE